MAFGKIRLQSQGLTSVAASFFPAAGCRIETVIDPALHHRETGKSRGKGWIEFDGLFEKRYGFQVRVGEHLLAIGVIVCLDEEQIGVGILGWPLIETCFFT